MIELEKLFVYSEKKLINAELLHKFLEVKTEYRKWIRRRIKDYDFQEDRDFRTNLGESSGCRKGKEFHLTITMAKELCMLDNSEKGNKARKYYLDQEERVKIAESLLTENQMKEYKKKTKHLESELNQKKDEIKSLTDKDGMLTANKIKLI